MALTALPPIGIVSVQQLRAMGWSRADIDGALRARTLWRIPEGLLLPAVGRAASRSSRPPRRHRHRTDGPAPARRPGAAVRVSAARALRENAARLSEPDHRCQQLGSGDPGVHVHWTRSWPVRGSLATSSPIVPPLLALEQSFGCLPGETMVAVMDSALYQRLVIPADLQAFRRRIPAHLQPLVDEVDGCAHAGCESLVRARLRRIGLRVVPQRRVVEAVRIDLVVEDVLGIETDGAQSHAVLEQLLEDRRRDLVLAGAALDRLRLTQAQVLDVRAGGPGSGPTLPSGRRELMGAARIQDERRESGGNAARRPASG